MVANILASTAIPQDLDYDHYITVAHQLVQDIARQKPPKAKCRKTGAARSTLEPNRI
jgi:hypothetical protein